MAEDELIDQLRRWGEAKNARRAANDDGYATREHVISRQRDMALAHKRKQEDEREIIGRSGEERRRFMAAKISADYVPGQKGARLRMAIVPEWAVDPIRSRDDGDRPHDRSPSLVDLVPDDLHWIDRALARLERDCRIRALVLREEFCGVGTQTAKASRVERDYGGKLSVWMYRRELQRAMDWMRAKAA